MSAPTARWPLACFLAMGVFWGTWAALLPALKEQAGATDGELGLAMMGIGAGALPGMILAGRLWRRAGWWLLPVTAFGFAVAVLGLLVARSPLVLGLALVLVGAGSGALDVSMNSAVSDVEAAHDRRLMYGAHALFSLAVLVGSVATGLARQGGAGPVLLLPVAAIVLAAVAIGSFIAAREAARTGHAETSGAAGAEVAIRAIAALAALCVLSFLIEDALQNWSAIHLERDLGSSPAIGGAAPGIFAGAMFVGRSAGQWLGARFSDQLLLSSGALAAAAGLLISATAGSPIIALLGLAVAGGGVALVAPALFARAGRTTDARGRGAAIATLTTFGYMGFVVGPVIVGLLAQAYGLRFAIGALALLALALSVGGLIVLRGPAAANEFATGEELLHTSRG